MHVEGAAKRGILLSDIQAGWSFDILPTGSDVLAIHQSEVCPSLWEVKLR